MRRECNVLDYLDRAVNQNPQKIAFVDETKEISYQELDHLSDLVASIILKTYKEPNRAVAILVDRDIASIVMIIGVIKSHHFYVPIDASQPSHRINSILHQMEPEILLAKNNASEDLLEILQIPLMEYENLVNGSVDEVLLQETQKMIIDSDPLVAVCTSGSTGIPKGVIKSHRTVLSFIPVFIETFDFSESDVFGNQAPFDFDVSLKDIFTVLSLGATLIILPRKCFSMPKYLMDTLIYQKVSVIIWAVSALCIVADLNVFKYKVPYTLKKILFSGEVMPVKKLNTWRNYLPDAMFVNLYGPTEVTGNILYYIIDRPFEDNQKLPLGKPFSNERVLILNENNEQIKAEETGEICVISPCMAFGYYRNKEKTDSVFVQNPLNKDYPETIYRTGDMANMTCDGELFFVSRKDSQIKHMGHRIELDEIELHLNAVNGVTRAVCLFDEEKSKIAACYSGNADKKEIIEQLKIYLPKYMIPNIFLNFTEIPMNKNGKINRQRVRELYREGSK